jgi:hypothetical protein
VAPEKPPAPPAVTVRPVASGSARREAEASFLEEAEPAAEPAAKGLWKTMLDRAVEKAAAEPTAATSRAPPNPKVAHEACGGGDMDYEQDVAFIEERARLGRAADPGAAALSKEAERSRAPTPPSGGGRVEAGAAPPTRVRSALVAYVAPKPSVFDFDAEELELGSAHPPRPALDTSASAKRGSEAAGYLPPAKRRQTGERGPSPTENALDALMHDARSRKGAVGRVIPRVSKPAGALTALEKIKRGLPPSVFASPAAPAPRIHKRTVSCGARAGCCWRMLT